MNYECGSWFPRSSEGKSCQIDFLYISADRVVTLCEIKFRDQKIGKGIINEVEKKRTLFPNPKKLTIETVLITASAPTEDLVQEKYFNRILLLEDLFGG